MDFQTPREVCAYMASLLPRDPGTILEPTPGEGNLVSELRKLGGRVFAPSDFFALSPRRRFDWVVMNPPFSPMNVGYEILYRCMQLSDRIVALMPWLTIINSAKRTRDLLDFGLVSVTHLPRNTFKGARVQTCVLHLEKGSRRTVRLLFWKP